MRINIDIDDAVMAAAMKAGGFATKKETVEEALRLLVRKQAYEGIRAVRGAVAWVGNLSQMRQDRVDYCEPIVVKKALAKRPFRIQTAFWQIAQLAAKKVGADLIIVDVGPNLGAINRSALVASDFVAIPIGADLFSLQGLSNLGPALRTWRSQWKRRIDNWQTPTFGLPSGSMEPIGYLLQQYPVRQSRPARADDRWVAKIPNEYRKSVLDIEPAPAALRAADDSYCLAMLKHYRSLIALSQESRKPLFS